MALSFDHPNRDRNPLYLHPRILGELEQLMERISEAGGGEFEVKVLSTHRTPQEQFELFKKGRVFRNGSWVKIPGGNSVTNIDGHSKLSRHNYLPALACDFGLFRGREYIQADEPYDIIGPPAREAGFGWGGDWQSFKDKPHIQLEPKDMFKGSFVKDVALQWQRYLQMAGTYTGNLDGIFGDKSSAALRDVTGFDQRTAEGWEALFRQFGPLEPDE
jgi:peptidoglycan L-alanyl-D-glutamate endopeptidase CwlK